MPRMEGKPSDGMHHPSFLRQLGWSPLTLGTGIRSSRCILEQGTREDFELDTDLEFDTDLFSSDQRIPNCEGQFDKADIIILLNVFIYFFMYLSVSYTHLRAHET